MGQFAVRAITTWLSPASLRPEAWVSVLHCRCFYNQDKGVVQQRIQEHSQMFGQTTSTWSTFPLFSLPCPLSIYRVLVSRGPHLESHGRVPGDIIGL